MAVDLATAKKYYASNGGGAQPPTGMSFDDWVLAWFTNAVDAGTPSAVKASGGTTAEGADPSKNYSTGGQADSSNAAPSSEWLGKRKPTPRELRRYARDTGQSEDYARYDDKQLAAWLTSSWDVANGGFTNEFGDKVEKPTESGAGSRAAGYATGEKSAGMGGGGGGGGWKDGWMTNQGGAAGAGTFGGAPGFQFKAPTWEEAMSDPGYEFALKEGQKQLEGSAWAKGLGRSSGTLKDLIGYGQDMAQTQYGNVYNRQYALAKDVFAPQYGSWQTAYDAALAKWQAKYGGDLQKYLQKEQNIYGLLNPSFPTY